MVIILVTKSLLQLSIYSVSTGATSVSAAETVVLIEDDLLGIPDPGSSSANRHKLATAETL